jgi:hypothetical protein
LIITIIILKSKKDLINLGLQINEPLGAGQITLHLLTADLEPLDALIHPPQITVILLPAIKVEQVEIFAELDSVLIRVQLLFRVQTFVFCVVVQLENEGFSSSPNPSAFFPRKIFVASESFTEFGFYQSYCGTHVVAIRM